MRIRKFNEACDDVNYDEFVKEKTGRYFNIDYEEGYPFFYNVEDFKMILGKLGEIHSNMKERVKEEIENYSGTLKEGRYWYGKMNIISFWNWPDKNEWGRFKELFKENTG